MACSKCGNAVPAGAAFCPMCGQAQAVRPQPVSRTATPGQASVAPSGGLQNSFDSQRKKQGALAIVLGIILAVGAIVGVVIGTGVLQRGDKLAGVPSLQAKGETPRGSLPLQGEQAPAAMPKTAERAVMPDDVRAWLLHLEQIEARKVELSLRQTADMIKFQQMISVLGAGIGAMNPFDMSEGEETPPDQVTQSKFTDLKPEWEQLIADFQSFPPPQECQPLANDYFRAISEIPGMTSDIIDILNNVTADPSGALQRISTLQGKSYNDIGKYFIQSDQRLGDICSKYNERKWFNIKSDVVGVGTLGKLGGTMSGSR